MIRLSTPRLRIAALSLPSTLPVFLCALLGIPAPLAAQSVEPDEETTPVARVLPGRYLVEFRTEPAVRKAPAAGWARSKARQEVLEAVEQFRSDLAAIRSARTGQARSAGQIKFRHTYTNAYSGVAVEMSPTEAADAAGLGYVRRVHPEKIELPVLAQSVPLIGATAAQTDYSTTGAGALVSIIDTGIDYTHASLGGGFGPGFKVVSGYDFYSNDADPMDSAGGSYGGHGTLAAGIVAGSGTTNGVAPGASLMACRACSTTAGCPQSAIVAAIDYSLDPDNNPATDDAADIINVSIGGQGDSTEPTAVAAQNAAEAGVVVVVAAANNGNYETIGTMGQAPDVITVGAADKSDQIHTIRFSSRGPALGTGDMKPDLVAPGYQVLSTYPGGGTSSVSGTSFAAPHVAGAAALLRQLHPDWSASQIKAALTGTALNIGHDAMTQGAGRVDVLAAAGTGLLFDPPVLNLGPSDDSGPTSSAVQTITVTNVSATTVTWNFSLDLTRLPAGAGVVVTPSAVLDPGTSAALTLQLTVDNATVLPLYAPPYAYEGAVIAEAAGHSSVRLPFVFSRDQNDPFEPNNSAVEASPVTLSENRKLVRNLTRTKLDPRQPGASTPDEDWYQFTATAGQKLNVQLQLPYASGSTLPAVELKSAALATLTSGYRNATSELENKIRFYTIPADGTYYLRVASSVHVGPYRLYAWFAPTDMDVLWDAPNLPTAGVEFSDSGASLHVTHDTTSWAPYTWFSTLDTATGALDYSLTESGRTAELAAASEGTLVATLDRMRDSGSKLIEHRSSNSPTVIFSDLAGATGAVQVHVAKDGARVAEWSSGTLTLRNSTGTLIHSLATDYVLNQLKAISEDCLVAVIYHAKSASRVIYNTADGTVRQTFTGVYQAFNMDGTGNRLVLHKGNYHTLYGYDWNGSSYDEVWTYQTGNAYQESTFGGGFAVSGDGSMVALIMGTTRGAQLIFVDGNTGEEIYRRPFLVPDVPSYLTVPLSFGFNSDGSLLGISMFGGSRAEGEMMVFSPHVSSPLLELPSFGSAYANDVSGTWAAFSSRDSYASIAAFSAKGELYAKNLAPLLANLPPLVRDVEAPFYANPAVTSTVPITCRVTDSNGVGAVEAVIESPDETAHATVALFDDGAHGDGAAGDGLFGANWTLPSPERAYVVDIVTTDTLGVGTISDNAARLNTVPVPWPRPIAINLNSGTTLTPNVFNYFGVTVENAGAVKAVGVTARIYTNDPYVIAQNNALAPGVGNLVAGASAATSINQLFIRPDATIPNNYSVPIRVVLEDQAGNVWEETIATPATIPVEMTHWELE